MDICNYYNAKEDIFNVIYNKNFWGINLNIDGAKELKLVATDGGNGNAADHASFGHPKLYFVNEDIN